MKRYRLYLSRINSIFTISLWKDVRRILGTDIQRNEWFSWKSDGV